jgi:hypothetical protein
LVDVDIRTPQPQPSGLTQTTNAYAARLICIPSLGSKCAGPDTMRTGRVPLLFSRGPHISATQATCHLGPTPSPAYDTTLPRRRRMPHVFAGATVRNSARHMPQFLCHRPRAHLTAPILVPIFRSSPRHRPKVSTP